MPWRCDWRICLFALGLLGLLAAEMLVRRVRRVLGR